MSKKLLCPLNGFYVFLIDQKNTAPHYSDLNASSSIGEAQSVLQTPDNPSELLSTLTDVINTGACMEKSESELSLQAIKRKTTINIKTKRLAIEFIIIPRPYFIYSPPSKLKPPQVDEPLVSP